LLLQKVCSDELMNARVSGNRFRCWQRKSAAARLYGSDTEITGLHSWLTDYGPVAALDVMLAAHMKIIHRFTAVLFSPNFVVMCYFKLVHAILCGILAIFVVCYF